MPNSSSPASISAARRLGGAAGGNERFFAAGNERTHSLITDGHGYYVGTGDDWGLVYHVMNMSPAPKTVYFEYKFTWVDADEHPLDRVRPIWIDVDQCNDSEIDVPAGYSDVHWSWQADRSHTMTDIGGHVHDYGLSIAWRNKRNPLAKAGFRIGDRLIRLNGQPLEDPAQIAYIVIGLRERFEVCAARDGADYCRVVVAAGG